MIEGRASGKRVDKPRVSVVIPTYNRAKDLKRCLDSLLEQTVHEFEVLICDDGSTDGTADVWMAYSPFLDITYDYGENFGGPARPRNRGIELARAPYVAFLDSDDWWAPRKLEVSLERLDRGADVVYHDLFFAAGSDKKREWRRARTRDLTNPAFDDLLVNGNALANSSVVLRKTLLDEIGGFSEDKALIAAEDFDAWLRVARLTEKFERIPDALGYYWTGGGNISNPARIVKNLGALERHFADAILVLEEARTIYWMKYAKGRAYFRLKSYEMARDNLGFIRWKGTPFPIYAKSKLILAWIIFVTAFSV